MCVSLCSVTTVVTFLYTDWVSCSATCCVWPGDKNTQWFGGKECLNLLCMCELPCWFTPPYPHPGSHPPTEPWPVYKAAEMLQLKGRAQQTEASEHHLHHHPTPQSWGTAVSTLGISSAGTRTPTCVSVCRPSALCGRSPWLYFLGFSFATTRSRTVTGPRWRNTTTSAVTLRTTSTTDIPVSLTFGRVFFFFYIYLNKLFQPRISSAKMLISKLASDNCLDVHSNMCI